MHEVGARGARDGRSGNARQSASRRQGSAKNRALSGRAEDRPEVRPVPVFHRRQQPNSRRNLPTGRGPHQPQRLVRAVRGQDLRRCALVTTAKAGVQDNGTAHGGR